MIKTSWQCDTCGGRGTIEHHDQVDVWTMVELIRGEHDVGQRDQDSRCDTGLSRVRVTLLERDAEPDSDYHVLQFDHENIAEHVTAAINANARKAKAKCQASSVAGIWLVTVRTC